MTKTKETNRIFEECGTTTKDLHRNNRIYNNSLNVFFIFEVSIAWYRISG